ncbi:hypothetical protein [Puia sp.]|jgi:anti-sigma-K factor RskA|uniref:hypothetical protein n=1 Tax=Puia sp. TaxID=2045100 RepID=UPI002F3E44D1
MRNELNETFLIDQWLLGQLCAEEAQDFEARLVLDEAFAEKVEAQRTAHRMVRRYARREGRHRLESIYRQLLHEADFAHRIKTIFA